MELSVTKILITLVVDTKSVITVYKNIIKFDKKWKNVILEIVNDESFCVNLALNIAIAKLNCS